MHGAMQMDRGTAGMPVRAYVAASHGCRQAVQRFTMLQRVCHLFGPLKV